MGKTAGLNFDVFLDDHGMFQKSVESIQLRAKEATITINEYLFYK